MLPNDALADAGSAPEVEPQYSDEPPMVCTPQPDVPKPEAISLERCLDLVFALARCVPNIGEGVRFDSDAAVVLWSLLGRHHELADGTAAVRVSNAALAGPYNLSLKVVRARLRLLAAFGLLQAVHPEADGRVQCQAGNFYFNPLMVQLVLKRGGRKLSKAALEPFLAMGLARDQAMRYPQGWRGHDVEYGEREPAPATEAVNGRPLAPWAKTLGSELDALEEAAAAVNAVSASKSLRAQERIRRAALSEGFIRGCATIWQQAHERRGYGGTGRPAWEGPKDGLSPENKKQFRELQMLFERFGGKQVAMAWAVFCNYQPFFDDKGKLKFDPNLPHVQWVSSDKKPSHFAKHFDAVQMDPETRKRLEDASACGRIEAIVGSTYQTPPAPPLQVAAAKGGRP